MKNLNSFPGAPPMVCERKVNPKFPEFSKPTWQPLDALERLDLLEQIERLRPSHNEEEYIRNREKLLAWLKDHIANGTIRLAVAEIDIEQDGAVETVLKHEYANCDPADEVQFTGMSGQSFYVLTPDKLKLDTEKSGSFSIGLRADMVTFNERPYITVWAGDLGFKNGVLSVYRPFSLVGTQPGRCDYRYKTSKARRQP